MQPTIVHQDQALRQAAGQAFCNTSKFTLRDLRNRASPQQLKADFEAYLDGFSVKLMASLIFLPNGTGGMLTVAEETLQGLAEAHAKQVATHLYGQEINAGTYAIAKADLLLRARASRRTTSSAVRSTPRSPTRPSRLWKWYPRRESNLRTWFRKPLLYPLSYGGT